MFEPSQPPSDERTPAEACYDRGLERLREGDHKVTPQRRAVLELFRERGEHLTPNEIFETLEPRLPSLSLATVYNTLELFEREGIVARFTSASGETYYDPNIAPHHHAVCRECGGLFDVDVDRETLDDLTDRFETFDHEEQDFEVEEATVWFRGRCESCRTSSTRTAE